MSGRSITIRNVLESMKNGEIPAVLVDGVVQFKKLEYIDARGNLRYWQIIVEAAIVADRQIISIIKLTEDMLSGAKTDYVGIIKVHSGIEGGKDREIVPTIVSTGKNLGKKNETTPITQAVRDALGTYNTQARKYNVDSGAKPAAAVADVSHTDCEMFSPMLSSKLDDTSRAHLTENDFAVGVYVQPKFDGVRCIACKCDGKVVLYSRGLKEIPGCNKIKSDLEIVFGEWTHNPVYLDGELYIHGKSLNYISGQVRSQSDADTLEYYIYDMFFPGDESVSFANRNIFLEELAHYRLQSIKVIPGLIVHSEASLKEQYHHYREQNYEGLMARRASGVYIYGKSGYRSVDIIKYKERDSKEYPIIDFTEGATGKDVGAIIYICTTGTHTFNVVPNMSLENRKNLFSYLNQHRDEFDSIIRNAPLTVEYSILSEKTGIPLQPKGIVIRIDDDIPRHDKLMGLFAAANVKIE